MCENGNWNTVRIKAFLNIENDTKFYSFIYKEWYKFILMLFQVYKLTINYAFSLKTLQIDRSISTKFCPCGNVKNPKSSISNYELQFMVTLDLTNHGSPFFFDLPRFSAETPPSKSFWKCPRTCWIFSSFKTYYRSHISLKKS